MGEETTRGLVEGGGRGFVGAVGAWSRRHFLAAAGAAGVCLSAGASFEDGEVLPVPAGASRSRVAMVRCRGSVSPNGEVVPALVGDMLARMLTLVTGRSTAGEAWGTLLRADDVIGLKFNQSGQAGLGTTECVGGTLIRSLLEAGWPARQIVCIEAPVGLEASFGTTPAFAGFRDEVTDFGSGRDQFAKVLDQVTAIVNVPFLKTHNIATMTACLKNLSHGLIRHPARCHGNGCTPYISDIVAQPLIRDKLRLHVVDALKVVFDGGPSVQARGVADWGLLLGSVDPVAADAVGMEVLNGVRGSRRLPVLASKVEPPAFLAEAHRRGLGFAAWRGIELLEARVG